MNNFEKYSKLHDEVMKRLENGEITIETAKEVNDLAFDKYINNDVNSSTLTESIRDIINNIWCGIENFKEKDKSYDYVKFNADLLDKDSVAKLNEYKDAMKSFDDIIKKAIDDAWTEFDKKHNIEKLPKSIISINPRFKLTACKCYRKNKLKYVDVYISRQYATSKSFKSAENIDKFMDILVDILDDIYKSLPESIEKMNIEPSLEWDPTEKFTFQITSVKTVRKYSVKDAEKELNMRE